jgi:thiamine biosynthesis lipoprotein
MRAAAALLACLSLGSQSPRTLAFFEYQQPHMGTTVRIQIYAATAADGERISSAAFERIRELDDRFSDYSDASELAGVSRAAGGDAVAVSEDLFRIIERAQRIAATTEGAFDITIGPVSHLWRRARAAGQAPDAARLEAATRLVGYRRLHLSAAARTVRLAERGMVLDLGGVAKGFAADAALETMVRLGGERSVVAIGGDIVAAEAPPGKPAWDVAIQALGGAGKPPLRTIQLRRGALSTSGDAEQFLDVGERHYSHIMNPRTGSAETGRRSVTVRAPDGATADALATAIKALGRERGLRLVDRFPEAEALITVEEGNSQRVFPSRRWRDGP